MNAAAGWVVAAIVIIAAGVFYFWPQMSKAPADTGAQQATSTPQTSNTKENIGDPKMSGMWQSKTDAKFTREIRPDGVMIDRYEGDAGAGTGGEWSTVNASALPANSKLAANLSGLPIIQVVWDGGVETTFFVVNKVDDKTMTTTDLTGRGEVTTYTKVMMTQ